MSAGRSCYYVLGGVALRALLHYLLSDKLRGGRADGRVPADFDPQQLAVGIQIELEHTRDRALAQEIAMDHLAEDLRYYDKLIAAGL